MDALESWLAGADADLWTWAVFPLVAVLAVYFTIRTGVVQIRLLPRMFRTLGDRTPTDAEGRTQSLSAFQAFTVSAASRVGIGNIAGVGTAIAVGGPGAVMWMWVMALFGASASFVEATLAQLYKHRDPDGFRGGPAYYIHRGLRSRWLGVAFAVMLIVSSPLAVNSLQAFTVVESLELSVGDTLPLPVTVTLAAVLAAMTASVIFGGARRIALFTETLVPAMALLYLALGVVIVVIHADQLGAVLAEIFHDAVTGEAVAGGALGTVIVTGVQRGMFSSEAGLGTAPNAAATAATTHPVKQGLVQSLGVYFDTLLVCTITAMIVLIPRPDLASAEPGISLTHDAVVDSLGGWSGYLLTGIVFLLAFSTILGLYYYGESNLEFISERRDLLLAYRVLAIAAVFVGCLLSAQLLWTVADVLVGLLAVINLIAIGLLSPLAFGLLRHYSAQLRAGRDPVFTRDQLPAARGVEVWEDEQTVTGLPPQAREEPPPGR